jgi:hypothetical protein
MKKGRRSNYGRKREDSLGSWRQLKEGIPKTRPTVTACGVICWGRATERHQDSLNRQLKLVCDSNLKPFKEEKDSENGLI